MRVVENGGPLGGQSFYSFQDPSGNLQGPSGNAGNSNHGNSHEFSGECNGVLPLPGSFRDHSGILPE